MMNNLALARSAYGNAEAPIRTDRSIEYQAFANVTCAMSSLQNGAPTDFPKLVEALHKNRELWSILGEDVASDDNQLPTQLRAQIFSLFRFVDKYTPDVLKGDAEVAPLIEINTTIMRGLRSESGS